MTPTEADAPPVPPQPTRVLGRRLALPSGRAVIGAALVTVAVVGLFTAYRRADARPTTSYVVMARTVAAGTHIRADDLTTAVLELGALTDHAVTDPATAVGALAAQTLVGGHILQSSNLVVAGRGAGTDSRIEVSFAVERSQALGGDLSPGDVVDIVATGAGPGGACTEVVARSANLTAIVSGSGDLVVPGRHLTITAAVDDDATALRLIHAADEARLHMTRSTRVGFSPLTGRYCGLDATEPHPGAGQPASSSPSGSD